MKSLSLMEIVKAVYAIDYTARNRQQVITNVEFDSRKITPGSLFIPLTGGTTDGHDYVQQAIAQGAVATLWSAAQETAPTDEIACIFVDDTLEAMQKLAKYYREVLDPIVIGITGSNGKTTTKDMTANVLTAKYQVHKTQGNFNNEIGLPYTLLQMPESTEVVVCEMGTNHFGDISLLSQLAQPDIVAITLIGESHLEFLESRQGVARAKLEILEGLQAEGLFIYPGNEPLLEAEMPELSPSIQKLRFGFSEDYEIYASDMIEEANKTYFRTNLDPQVLCMIPVMGAYNVSNALIALGIAKYLQVPIEQAIFQLAQFRLTGNRLEWLKTKNGASLLNDAYNASPTSMKAVLQTFAKIERPAKGRKIIVLGDIRELGVDSASYHQSLQAYIQPEAFQRIFLFGDQMQYLYQALQGSYETDTISHVASDHAELIRQLEQEIHPEDLVLVKSSFGVDLLSVVSALTGHSTH